MPRPVKLYDKIPLNQGVVLDLPLFEGTGTLARDISKYHNNGVFKGAGEPAWVQLPSGIWVLSFDGADDFVNCGNSVALRITGNITVGAWVAPTALISGNRILERAQWIPRRGYYLSAYSATQVAFTVHYGDTSYVMPCTVPLGTWTCVVGIFDGSKVRVYVNGVEVGTGTTGPPSIDDCAVTKSLFIGSDNGTWSFWQGLIGEVRIYNRALSAAEIMSRYLQTKGAYGL